MKKNTILFLILSCFFSGHALAQEFWQHKNALDFPSVSDLGISPLNYEGIGYTLGSGYYFIHNEYIVDANFNVGLAAVFVLSDSVVSNNYCAAIKFQNEFTILKQVPINYCEIKQYIGIGSQINLNFRTYSELGNSSLSYDILNSVTLNSITMRDFTYKKKNYAFSFSWSIPIITTLIRPNYIHLLDFTYPEFDILSDFTDNTSIGSIIKYPRFIYKASLIYKPEIGNMFEFFFSSDTYVLKTANPVLSTNKSFGLNVFFKLR